MKRLKISGDPEKNWYNDAIQFPRFIEEAQAAGAFTPKVLKQMGESMDLDKGQLEEIMERAQVQWDEIKRKTYTTKLGAK